MQHIVSRLPGLLLGKKSAGVRNVKDTDEESVCGLTFGFFFRVMSGAVHILQSTDFAFPA